MIVNLLHPVQDQTRLRHNTNYQYNNCCPPQPLYFDKCNIYHLMQKYCEKYIDIEVIHNRPVDHDRRSTLIFGILLFNPIIFFRPFKIIVNILFFPLFKSMFFKKLK